MSKDPAAVRKALFANDHKKSNDSVFYDGQLSLNSKNNAPKIGTFLVVIVVAAIVAKNIHWISEYLFFFSTFIFVSS